MVINTGCHSNETGGLFTPQCCFSCLLSGFEYMHQADKQLLFGVWRHPAPTKRPTVIMQAVQEMSTPFKDSTLSCGCAPIQMSLDEIVCRGVMDSWGNYSAWGMMIRHCGWTLTHSHSILLSCFDAWYASYQLGRDVLDSLFTLARLVVTAAMLSLTMVNQ